MQQQSYSQRAQQNIPALPWSLLTISQLQRVMKAERCTGPLDRVKFSLLLQQLIGCNHMPLDSHRHHATHDCLTWHSVSALMHPLCHKCSPHSVTKIASQLSYLLRAHRCVQLPFSAVASQWSVPPPFFRAYRVVATSALPLGSCSEQPVCLPMRISSPFLPVLYCLQ